jgi:hypothetical protein
MMHEAVTGHSSIAMTGALEGMFGNIIMIFDLI